MRSLIDRTQSRVSRAGGFAPREVGFQPASKEQAKTQVGGYIPQLLAREAFEDPFAITIQDRDVDGEEGHLWHGVQSRPPELPRYCLLS